VLTSTGVPQKTLPASQCKAAGSTRGAGERGPRPAKAGNRVAPHLALAIRRPPIIADLSVHERILSLSGPAIDPAFQALHWTERGHAAPHTGAGDWTCQACASCATLFAFL
jgi:hypothetical protein